MSEGRTMPDGRSMPVDGTAPDPVAPPHAAISRAGTASTAASRDEDRTVMWSTPGVAGRDAGPSR